MFLFQLYYILVQHTKSNIKYRSAKIFNISSIKKNISNVKGHVSSIININGQKKHIVNFFISLYLLKRNNKKNLDIEMIIFRIFIVPTTFTFDL